MRKPIKSKKRSVLALVVVLAAVFLHGCAAVPPPPEPVVAAKPTRSPTLPSISASTAVAVPLTDEQLKDCRISAGVMTDLAMLRDKSLTPGEAIERYLAEKPALGAQKGDGNQKLQEDLKKRVRLIYAISEFSPSTFADFDFSICRMKYQFGWRPQFKQMAEIQDQVVECQNLQTTRPRTLECISKVVLNHHQ